LCNREGGVKKQDAGKTPASTPRQSNAAVWPRWVALVSTSANDPRLVAQAFAPYDECSLIPLLETEGAHGQAAALAVERRSAATCWRRWAKRFERVWLVMGPPIPGWA
jgi:hypothetical protein